MNRTADKIISIFAGIAVTGGLAWGLYLQGRVDAANATVAAHETRLEVYQTDLGYIKDALYRIEGKLDKKEAGK